MLDFVHLRTHSAFSLLEGAIPLKQLIELAAADRQPALALTDRGNLFGALEFSEKASSAGIQPIIGCELGVDFADEGPSGRPPQHKGYPVIVLLAMSAKGFANLSALSSASFLDTSTDMAPHVTMADLAAHSEDLILLSGGRLGPIDVALKEGSDEHARSRLAKLKAAFPERLYLEVQRHRRLETEEASVMTLAFEEELPIVATGDCYFPTQDDFAAHDALICIADGRYVGEDERRRFSPDQAFQTRAEIKALFADLPEAIANTVEIAQRCSYRPLTRDPILPRFAGSGEAGEAEELRRQAQEGLRERLKTQGAAPDISAGEYEARLASELDIIVDMKFPGYFLIVADFIKWAKEREIPVGPGRGSGAGSLVAYALTITDLDPLRFDLLFERFLNPERVSMPDFDIDFCQDRRDEVINYVQEKYGADQVAQIITFGSLQARAVLRDVGRVLQMPYGQVDRLCKLVPANPANPVTLGQAIADEPRLREAIEAEEVVKRLTDVAQRLEGLFRHASTHAAGIVIGDRPLVELVPLYRDPRSDMPVTQYNMKWVEQAGLVKFDFLGLKTLTVLEKAVQSIRSLGGEMDIAAIPLDDAKTYEMLARGETVGVFQLESAGMRKALVEMAPDRFEDIIAIVALYRPGPMANIPAYCARKHGKEQPDYIHPLLEPILKETFGVIIYQEQVMQVAQILSGYSLGEADILRRAMGKKIKEEMDKQRSRFIEGAANKGLSGHDADAIFDVLAKFADYGFNKSHAAAYALVAYQTAYLKANFPVSFLAASMTLDMGNTDKLSEFRREALRLNIDVVPPSVQRSDVEFVASENAIFYALGAIKGVGHQPAEAIIEARAEKPFTSIGDFADRIPARSLNKRTLESLVASGAFDEINRNRCQLTAGLDLILAQSQRRQAAEATGQNDFFGSEARDGEINLPSPEPWTQEEELRREFQAVGFYLSAHPLDAYAALFDRLRIQLWAPFEKAVRNGASAGRLAGTISGRLERRTRTGNKMGICQISDPSGQYEAIIFAEGLQNYRDILEPGRSVLLYVSAEMRQEGVSVRIERAEPLEKAVSKVSQSMRLFVNEASAVSHIANQLKSRTGEGEVSVIVLGECAGSEVEVRLPGGFQVAPDVAKSLRAVQGVDHVELI